MRCYYCNNYFENYSNRNKKISTICLDCIKNKQLSFKNEINLYFKKFKNCNQDITCKVCGENKNINNFSEKLLFTYILYKYIDYKTLELFNIEYYKDSNPIKTACCLNCMNYNSNISCSYFYHGNQLFKLHKKVSNFNRVFK